MKKYTEEWYKAERAKREALKETYLIEVNKEISTMSNNELLSNFVDLAGGDDYDGCFSTRGDIRFKAFERELYDRLYKEGFLDQPM